VRHNILLDPRFPVDALAAETFPSQEMGMGMGMDLNDFHSDWSQTRDGIHGCAPSGQDPSLQLHPDNADSPGYLSWEVHLVYK
jgi:hypothetical protein